MNSGVRQCLHHRRTPDHSQPNWRPTMARDNSTSKSGRGRKARSKARTTDGPSTRTVKRPSSNATDANLSEDFGGERAILMKAEAVLACLSVSLNYYGWSGDDGTLYAVAT